MQISRERGMRVRQPVRMCKGVGIGDVAQCLYRDDPEEAARCTVQLPYRSSA